jgi:hypothetical protein
LSVVSRRRRRRKRHPRQRLLLRLPRRLRRHPLRRLKRLPRRRQRLQRLRLQKRRCRVGDKRDMLYKKPSVWCTECSAFSFRRTEYPEIPPEAPTLVFARDLALPQDFSLHRGHFLITHESIEFVP